jgi:hypothetical protein
MKDAWNWLTYPCYELAYPEEALGNVIESIDYIMAEEWSMRKIHGVWEFDKNSRKPILRYGDSIMVRATDQVDLVWNAPNTIPDDRIPLKTSYYTYVDNPDYETLMIESIENAPDYLELGYFKVILVSGQESLKDIPCRYWHIQIVLALRVRDQDIHRRQRRA